MDFERAADVPVILVGDIDRGRVIAQIAGTTAVMDPSDAAMIAGFVINKSDAICAYSTMGTPL